MRIALPIVLAGAALAATSAFAEEKPAPAPAQPEAAPTNVTVNFGALPTPTPRRKPSPDEIRALTVPTPRHKPTPEEITAITAPTADVSVAPEPAPTAPSGAPAASVTTAAPTATMPFPRAKPQSDLAAAPAKAKPPKLATEAETAPTPSTPQNATDIATALRGTPVLSAKPVDPTAGFSVLTQVQFQNGRSELGDDAKTLLDALATRLLAGSERVRLAAFSGPPGDSSSGAHRLSLERGLAVRTYLVGKGVAADRLDVLALGGATKGTSDRVDVLVRPPAHRTG